jgi:hypothetical protein
MMGINLVVAVTDGDWFELLRQQPNLAEVNLGTIRREFPPCTRASCSCSSCMRRAM